MSQAIQPAATEYYCNAEDGLEAARKRLNEWLLAKKYRLAGCRDWARWTYGEIPFWSVWAEVSGGDENRFFYIGELGLHIYDDGRVACASRTWAGDETE